MGELTLKMPRQAEELEPYLWNSRLLLVFASSPNDTLLFEQIATLGAARSGLAERDLLVFTDSQSDHASALRKTYAFEGFAVLLIGKDGGVKSRSRAPVTAEELFTTIDAMPMRRREMQQQSE